MKRETDRDLLAKGRAQVKRNKNDGTFKEQDLRDVLRTFVVINVEKETDRRVQEIIDSETKPGSTKPTGQLRLPTLELYDYEPDRLIRNDDGDMIEQDRAPVDFKFAEARRARKHVSEALEWADRKEEEASSHAKWVIEQQKKGRTKKLTFGDFVREAGLFQPFEEENAA